MNLSLSDFNIIVGGRGSSFLSSVSYNTYQKFSSCEEPVSYESFERDLQAPSYSFMDYQTKINMKNKGNDSIRRTLPFQQRYQQYLWHKTVKI
jgi:hypothetical protein